MIVRFHVPRFICRTFAQYSNSRREIVTPKDFLWRFIECSNIKSAQDWKSVRSEVLQANGPITLANIDAITVGVCTNKKEYDLASSYIDFLKNENININLATIGKYFRLLYVKNMNKNLSQNDEEMIISLYESVRKVHPILDAITLDNIIQALSLTRNWKTCIDLMNEIKITSTPSSNCYSVIIAAAFSNESDAIAWELLKETIANERAIQPVVYCSYFKRCLARADPRKEVESMFDFMQNNNITLDDFVVNEVAESLKEIEGFIVNSSLIHRRGVCKHCNNKLKLFELTEKEFDELKTHFIKNVIIGKDVFTKTTPEELERFKSFFDEMDVFDVVVDGLNVAYSTGVKQPANVTSGLVASVVSHFTNLDKKVLVFGRKHMNKWPKKNLNYIYQNATVFLTDNLSQDDPYLLYSALNCGKNTIIVTRDLMRSHKFLLKDFRLKCLFDRWLSQRQYLLLRVADRGMPIFKDPLPYNQIAQKNGNCWHIPCSMPASKVSSASTHWLCVKT